MYMVHVREEMKEETRKGGREGCSITFKASPPSRWVGFRVALPTSTCVGLRVLWSCSVGGGVGWCRKSNG